MKLSLSSKRNCARTHQGAEVFRGLVCIGYEEGRSKVVATKCRDTVRAIMPALMRLFLQSDKPVEFIPDNPRTVQGAEQQTKYAATSSTETTFPRAV